MTDAEAGDLLQKRLGMVLALILYSRKPKTHHFIQSAMAVQMWRQSATDKLFLTLNHYGLTQCKAAARGHVDLLGQQHDVALLRWKQQYQVISQS